MVGPMRKVSVDALIIYEKGNDRIEPENGLVGVDLLGRRPRECRYGEDHDLSACGVCLVVGGVYALICDGMICFCAWVEPPRGWTRLAQTGLLRGIRERYVPFVFVKWSCDGGRGVVVSCRVASSRSW